MRKQFVEVKDEEKTIKTEKARKTARVPLNVIKSNICCCSR